MTIEIKMRTNLSSNAIHVNSNIDFNRKNNC